MSKTEETKACESKFENWLERMEDTAARCDRGISQHETGLMERAWEDAWAEGIAWYKDTSNSN